MCDIRLFRSAWLDYRLVQTIWETPYNDEMFLNHAAYHLQQCVEKVAKGALECVGVTVPNTHRLSRLFQMVHHNGANLVLTEWVDDHAEMLSEWEAEARNNMDFLVEKRKLEAAIQNVGEFLAVNGIQEELRGELREEGARERLLSFLPEEKRQCSDFDLNCYYLMFAKRL